MKKIIYDNQVWLQFELLLPYQHKIRHWSSTRPGGYSESPYSSLNLGYASGDREEAVTKNRELLAAFAEVEEAYSLFPAQVHGNHILEVNRPGEEDRTKADALMTSAAGLAINIQTADCVPVILYDPVRHVASVIHAGWRGTVTDITRKAVQKMVRLYATQPKDVIACIGPSISPQVYEVGGEVVTKAQAVCGEKVLIQQGNTSCFDLWLANKLQLLEEGVTEDHIEIAEQCTFSMPELFFSARRDGPHTGRMATGIKLL